MAADDDQAMTFEQSVQAAIELDAPLNERLGVIAAAVRRLNADFADAVDRLVARLEQQGAGVMAPSPGDVMPPFLLPDDEGRLVGLSDVLQRGPAVITFQRGHWCPYCRLNAIGIVEAQQEIAAQGGQVVAIMPERRRFAKAMKAAVGARFPFLTDMDNGYALSLNLAIWIGAKMERLMGVFYDLPNYQGNAAWFLPIPATFVVGTNGVISDRFVDPDYRRRMDIDDLIAALRRAR
ncbi:MAG: AhpC/TSA family protein [Mesorhizobium sp.]|nr:AhpC/TSA family protein [bacterium M00.F.Ca.ET.205.01.1.1]TGU46095.1 AhpC/TSA family protein [bacterium M00.F.Ca.ET.152.01.1.1]TGV35136.1 AhpC/TSA family protein [Mesorhizobium sp. M00.F.Ca.ET.186.01.1.1]TGZ43089.1 AhpC/TSA family protein [bacterium M00.F.Ca.ET.162.01.1.1]TIW61960.1 MAG: AhpC/TSA family protein [Mesorhizobium sp.]